MKLNVLTDFPYSKRYYLTHPWLWVKHSIQNLRDFWNRGTKGFTYCDVWNFDDWFCSVIPSMLRYLSRKGCAYPGCEPFDTPEKWNEWLNQMANEIEHLQCDIWMDDRNEYAEQYHESFESGVEEADKHITISGKPTVKEIRDLYYKRCDEITKTREEYLMNFGQKFFKHFDKLWD